MHVDVPVVAIDGPSGVGKGTLALTLSQTLGWHLLDSGALYRLVALSAVRRGTALDDAETLGGIARSLPVRFDVQAKQGVRIDLDGDDVTTAIREETVGEAASKVATQPSVRAGLLERQRDFRQAPGLVADGRDMGTVVFPEAPLKIFLNASAEVRARRRAAQLSVAEDSAIFERIYSDIIQRDERDATRATAPLKPADDAVIIDTSELGIEQVFERVMALVVERRLT
ncbi:MAG: (d)CMP kinase [Pseudomonadota bacterium]|nr:(d)CMP kinase [Pseudomonadota bacterium]